MNIRGNARRAAVDGRVNVRSTACDGVCVRDVAPNAGVAAMQACVASMHGGLASMQGPVASMHRGVASTQGSVASMHHGVASRHRSIASMHQGVASKQGSIASMHQRVASMHGGVASMQVPVAWMHCGAVGRPCLPARLRAHSAWRSRDALKRIVARGPRPAPFAGSHPKSPPPGFRSTVFK